MAVYRALTRPRPPQAFIHEQGFARLSTEKVTQPAQPITRTALALWAVWVGALTGLERGAVQLRPGQAAGQVYPPDELEHQQAQR
jgi:hypothetical protein